jgi:hypothetical protein
MFVILKTFDILNPNTWKKYLDGNIYIYIYIYKYRLLKGLKKNQIIIPKYSH